MIATSLTNTDRVVDLARSWIGTPYHHQASLKGIGCDCIGLIRGVWRELYGDEAEEIPAYSRDWGDVSGDDDLIGAANRHLIAVSKADLRDGCVFAIRWRGSASAKHVCIMSRDGRFIHGYEKSGVVETTLSPLWRTLIVGVWRYP